MWDNSLPHLNGTDEESIAVVNNCMHAMIMYCHVFHSLHRSHSVVVSTPDFESGIVGSKDTSYLCCGNPSGSKLFLIAPASRRSSTSASEHNISKPIEMMYTKLKKCLFVLQTYSASTKCAVTGISVRLSRGGGAFSAG